jgi:hypothetical protein
VPKLFVTDCEELYFVHDSVHSNCSFGCSICPSAESDSAIFRTTQSHMSHGCAQIFCTRIKCMFSDGQRSHQTLILQNIFEMIWINEFRHRPYPPTTIQDSEQALLQEYPSVYHQQTYQLFDTTCLDCNCCRRRTTSCIAGIKLLPCLNLEKL